MCALFFAFGTVYYTITVFCRFHDRLTANRCNFCYTVGYKDLGYRALQQEQTAGRLARRKRGAALPTVLALVSAVLVAGLAMGSLSTLSLQFNKRQMDSTRAELAARSGLAYFLSRVQQYETGEDQELNPLDPKSLAMADIFPEGLRVTEGDYTIKIHFDPNEEYYSTDNLAGEEPKLGFHDADDVPRIPPFGLDLVLVVESPSRTHVYRSVLKRFWPFAVYAKHGTLALMGQPELKLPPSNNTPTKVEGDVYTEWRVTDENGAPIVFEGRVKGYGLGDMDSPSQMLANLEARTGFQPWRVPYHPLILGMEGHLNNAPTIKGLEWEEDAGEKVEAFYYYDPSSWDDYGEWPRKWGETEFSAVDRDLVFPPPSPHLPSIKYAEVGNVLEGDLYYSHEANMETREWAVDGSVPGATPVDGLQVNVLQGDVHLRRPPARDPFEPIENGEDLDDSGFLGIPEPETDYVALEDYIRSRMPSLILSDLERDMSPPAFLTEDIVLTEGESSVNGTSVGASPQYTLHGSVSNRQVVFDKDTETLFVRESNAGLNLQGVTLRVRGDLNLGASAFEAEDKNGNGVIEPEEKPIQISGAGATLIVDGQLVLGNANINAGDQAFVIYANDIVIKAGGHFNGLLIAGETITILSQDEEPLYIEGGMACADKNGDFSGGITIRGAHVKHEPRYLKGINGAGDFYLASWRKI